MATLFWVGGTGTYDGTTNHFATTSGGTATVAAPTSADTVTFDGSSGGGTVTFSTALSCSTFTGGTFTGTIDTNGQTITTTGSFNFAGTATRTLTLGSSTINCGSFNIGTITNLTFNVNTSTIAQSGGNSGTIFAGGGLTYNVVTIASTNSANVDVSGANTFGTLTITGPANKTHNITLSGNQTITGTLTINGNSSTNRILISSSVVGTPRTITSASNSISNADFMDITGAGAASWNLSAITGLSGDCGGNSGITFTTPADQHWLNASTSVWSTASNWTSRVPLPQDNVFMDKAFGTSQSVTADMPRLGKSIDWTGATWTTALTFTHTTASSIFGSLTLISGLTSSGTSLMTLVGRSSYTLKTFSVVLTFGINVNAFNGTVTLQDDFTSTSPSVSGITISAGTFNAVTYNINVTVFSISSSFTKVINMGTGTVTLSGASPSATPWSASSSGLTFNADSSTIKLTDTTVAQTFAGGGLVYNNVWFSRGASTDNITISGSNTFAELKDTGTAAHSILFTAATTQTVSTFTVSGTAGNLITLDSTTTGTYTLTKSDGGVVSCDYLNIQHSLAKPGNWYAGTHSTNNQATVTAGSGWIFDIPPIPNKEFATNQAFKRASHY